MTLSRAQAGSPPGPAQRGCKAASATCPSPGTLGDRRKGLCACVRGSPSHAARKPRPRESGHACRWQRGCGGVWRGTRREAEWEEVCGCCPTAEQPSSALQHPFLPRSCPLHPPSHSPQGLKAHEPGNSSAHFTPERSRAGSPESSPRSIHLPVTLPSHSRRC